MPIEIPKDKWTGSVKSITIGATNAEGGTRAKSVTVGGQTSMPYLHYEAPMPNKPVIAIEVKSRKPDDWSPVLTEAWGDAMADPAQWAKKAEEAGADLIVLALTLADSPEDAVRVVKSVLSATGLPIIVWGPGQAEKDNDLLVPVSEATKGEKIMLLFESANLDESVFDLPDNFSIQRRIFPWQVFVRHFGPTEYVGECCGTESGLFDSANLRGNHPPLFQKLAMIPRWQ
jgi:acetyl-CoA decarbonylase/synthase complex subunit delta